MKKISKKTNKQHANTYPLNNFQKSFWHIEEKEINNKSPSIYTTVFRISGALNSQLLLRAIKYATETESPNIYSCLKNINNNIKGVILKPKKVKLTPQQDKRNIQKILTDITKDSKVSLKRGPLATFNITNTAPNEHLFIIHAHHFIFDGVTFSLLMKNITKNYNENIFHKNACALYKENLKNYLHFQRKFSKQKSNHDWDEYCKNIILNMADIESPFLSSPSQSSLSNEIKNIIKPHNLNAIKSILKIKKSSMNIFFSLVFSVLCHKISGQKKIIIEIPANIRKYGSTNFYGHYQYPLPLIVEIDQSLTFLENLEVLTKKIKNLKKRFESIDAIYQENQLRKYYSESDRILINQSMRNHNALLLDNLSSELIFTQSTGNIFDVQLDYEEHNSGLDIFLIYKKNKFSSNQMNFFSSQIPLLIAALIKNQRLLIEEYHYKHYDLEHLSQFPDKDFLTSTLEKNFNENNKNIAYRSSEESYSYKELQHLIENYRKIFDGECKHRPSLVLIYMDNTLSQIIVIITLIMLEIPIIIIDKKEPITRLLYYIEDSRASFVISHSRISQLINNKWRCLDDKYRKLLIYIKTPVFNQDDLLKKKIVYIAYTSGSTGKPKGIKVTRENLSNVLFYFYKKFDFSCCTKYLLISSPGFDIFFLELILPFLTGGTLLNALKLRENFNSLGAFIDQFKPDLIQTTPSYWHYLVEKIKLHRNFTLFTGGEPLSESLKIKLLSLTNKAYNVYGPTETTIWSTCTKVSLTKEPHITHPIFNTRLFVLNKNNQLTPPGFIGELFISGAGVADGYLHKHLNSNKFIKLSLPIKNSLETVYGFKTGDVVLLDKNKKIYFLNRNDNVVKINGIRVDLNEITSAILDLDIISNAHTLLNADKKTIVTFLILKENHKYAQEKEKTIYQHLRNKLPPYLIPSNTIFVDKFPMTKSNKIDSNALLVFAAKKTLPSEKKTCDVETVITHVLGIKDIDHSLSFFEQGGTSLRAIELATKISEKYSININLVDILQSSTIATVISLVKLQLKTSTRKNNIYAIAPRDRFEVLITTCFENATHNQKNPCILKPTIRSTSLIEKIFSLAKNYINFDLSKTRLQKIYSIESMANVIRKNLSEATLSPLVPFKINPLSNEYIFFIHAIGGNIWRYTELARLINHEVNIFGLESIGLSSTATPLKTMNEIISTYCDAICKLMPKKIIFVGWCMGAIIANKLALSLGINNFDISIIYINPSPYPLLNLRKNIRPIYNNILELMKNAFIENMHDHSQSTLFKNKEIVSLTSMALVFKKLYQKNDKENFNFYYTYSYFFRMLKVQYFNLKILLQETNTESNLSIFKHIFLSKNCFQKMNVSDDELISFLKSTDSIAGVTSLHDSHFTAVHGESAKTIAYFLSRYCAAIPKNDTRISS